MADRLINVQCHVLPDNTLTRSTEPIFPAARALLVSKDLNHDILKLIEYRTKTWYEMGLNNHKLLMHPVIIERLQISPNNQRALNCIENLNRIRHTSYSKALLVNTDWFMSDHVLQIGHFATTFLYLLNYLFDCNTYNSIRERNFQNNESLEIT